MISMKVAKRLVTTLVMALTAMMLLVGPASAYMPPHFGSAGICKMAMTQSSADGWTEARLHAIEALPPVMFSNEPGNAVGWRFILSRSTDGGVHYLKVYKSSLQKRIPVSPYSADFETRRVRLQVPDVDDPTQVRYRITLVMIHFNADGSVLDRSTYLMPHYIIKVGGQRVDLGSPAYCPGTARQAV